MSGFEPTPGVFASEERWLAGRGVGVGGGLAGWLAGASPASVSACSLPSRGRAPWALPHLNKVEAARLLVEGSFRCHASASFVSLAQRVDLLEHVLSEEVMPSGQAACNQRLWVALAAGSMRYRVQAAP
jgi:hypothetical protein